MATAGRPIWTLSTITIPVSTTTCPTCNQCLLLGSESVNFSLKLAQGFLVSLMGCRVIVVPILS